MRRFAPAAFAVLAAAGARVAPAQLMTGGPVELQFPFFAAGGGGGALSGAGKSLLHSIGEGAVTPMSGGTLTLAPGLMAAQPAATAGLSFVHAFPVPFRPARGEDRVTFRGLTTHATVRVYTLSGELVRVLVKDDPSTQDLVWTPVVNSDGQALAGGVYFYTVDGDGGRASGKLMVIR